MRFIGIDPGRSGGIAWIDTDLDRIGPQVSTAKLAGMTERDVWETLAGCDPAVVALEKVHAGPKMGSSAAFKFGASCAGLHMATIAAGLQVALVTPMKWQREFGLLVKGRGLGQRDVDKKNRNKAKAQELFPDIKITHAIADALLLAMYCKRKAGELF